MSDRVITHTKCKCGKQNYFMDHGIVGSYNVSLPRCCGESHTSTIDLDLELITSKEREIIELKRQLAEAKEGK